MPLHPCPRCHRHVASHETTCPFCAVPLAPASPRALTQVGRLSRAAVFVAGVTACSSNSQSQRMVPPHEAAPPPPGDTPPPPPPPIDAAIEPDAPQQTFAQPPPDAAVAAARGTLRLRVMRGGVSVGEGKQLEIQNMKGGGTHHVRTRKDGTVEIDLDPGNYTISAPTNHPRHSPAQTIAKIEAGKIAKVDFNIAMPVDPGPCCKPYGAPPARRRIV